MTFPACQDSFCCNPECDFHDVPGFDHALIAFVPIGSEELFQDLRPYAPGTGYTREVRRRMFVLDGGWAFFCTDCIASGAAESVMRKPATIA